MRWRIASPLTIATAVLASTPSVAQSAAEALPADVVAMIRKQYAGPAADTRYLDASVDLNGDGRPERIVHVVGAAACGAGGCPTLVFAPERSIHRLVSTIAPTQTPIRLGQGRVKGWRNLIVRVGGDGTRERDVGLSFDGRRYPGNPAAKGSVVTASRAREATVLIAGVSSQAGTKPLPASGGGAAPLVAAAPVVPAPSGAVMPAASAAANAALDCASATTRTERAICSDPALAALDRRMGEAFDKAMREWPPAERTAQRNAQREWISRLNACATSRTPRACIETSYRQRLIEVQIQGGLIEAPKPVGFVCKGHEGEPMTAMYYEQTDPKSAVISFGNRRAIAYIAPSGIGSRYLGENLEFWEHQGEALVTWSGKAYGCRVR